VRFHTRGRVYGITPDVVGESGVSDEACRGAAWLVASEMAERADDVR
jgi:hypothetical protein